MDFNELMQFNVSEEDLKSVSEYGSPELLKNLTSLREFISMQQLYSAAISEVETKLKILDTEFQVRFSRNPIHHIESRLKSTKSIFEKLLRYNFPVSTESIKNNIFDIAGIRVVCNYLDDVYRIADLLLNQADIRLRTKKDYIKNPKPNGYRSLHLVVEVPVFLSTGAVMTPAEIQIRTIAMDFWASLEHQARYKLDQDVSESLSRRLLSCAESIASLDEEMQSIYKEITN